MDVAGPAESHKQINCPSGASFTLSTVLVRSVGHPCVQCFRRQVF